MLNEMNAQNLMQSNDWIKFWFPDDLNNLPYSLVETCPFRQVCDTIFFCKEKIKINKIEWKKINRLTRFLVHFMAGFHETYPTKVFK